jgi:hypothetical protein
MKIAIISINMYSKGLNFASPLHSYVFQSFLKQHGYDTTIIDYVPAYYDNFDLEHPADYYRKKCQMLAEKNEKSVDSVKKMRKYSRKRDAFDSVYHEREIRYRKFKSFIDSHYIKTEKKYDSDLLEIEDPGFDCYICATDVIWSVNPDKGTDRGFLLGSKCMENKWKIAYSASFGARPPVEDHDFRKFFYNMEDIDFISVREKSAKTFIEQNSSRKAEHVLDPVLLEDSAFYEDITQAPEEKGYVLLYYVMENAGDTIDAAAHYARLHDKVIIDLTDRPDVDLLKEYRGIKYKRVYDIGIEEWLGYIRDADAIFTNSFHACCLSIIFHKKFFVGQRNGDKVTSVLDMFGLSDRLISNFSDPESMDEADIDYARVDEILSEKRKSSTEYIMNALKYCEENRKEPHSYEWWKRSVSFRMIYNSCSGGDPSMIPDDYASLKGSLKKLGSGNYEYTLPAPVTNSGYERFDECLFDYPDHAFRGWHIRFRIDNRWFWYLEDDTFVLKDEYKKHHEVRKKTFRAGERFPYIPVDGIIVMVAEAVWAKDENYVPKDHSAKKAGSGRSLVSRIGRRVRRKLSERKRISEFNSMKNDAGKK